VKREKLRRHASARQTKAGDDGTARTSPTSGDCHCADRFPDNTVAGN